MSRFKICFVFDEAGDYKPVHYAELMNGGKWCEEYADRYFLPLNGYLLEVTQEDYLDYYKTLNRQKYIQKEAQKAGEISFQSMIASEYESTWMFYEDVAEKIISDMMVESLHKAISLLNNDEQHLIKLLYFDEQTEKHCAEILGVSQSTINRRKKHILKKLKKIFKNYA